MLISNYEVVNRELRALAKDLPPGATRPDVEIGPRM